MLVAIPHTEFFKGIPAALEQVNDHMIDASNDRRITSIFTGGSHHRNLSAFYRVESISSGEMYPQHEPKQSFFGAIQKPSRQIANLDSGQANVSRADWFIFKPVWRGCEKTLWLPADRSENHHTR